MKKGYFVQGQFVAAGSERDLALKLELKGADGPSRSDLKRHSLELQKLGADLLALNDQTLAQLGLPDRLLEAMAQARSINSHEGRRRQIQFIGKLMRLLEPGLLAALQARLSQQAALAAAENLRLHQAESWRERLLADDQALADWLAQYPATDAQQLRALIRQARKDAGVALPAAASRHTRAYRELFQLLRQNLDARESMPFDISAEAS